MPSGATRCEANGYQTGDRIAAVERQIDMIATTQYEEARALRRSADERARQLEELRQRLEELDGKFHECFEPCDESEVERLRRDLGALRAQVIFHGNTNNDSMQKVDGEFDQVNDALGGIFATIMDPDCDATDDAQPQNTP